MRTRSKVIASVSCLFSAGIAVAAGCGGDDTSGAQTADGGSDITTTDASGSDGSTKDGSISDGSLSDGSPFDAGPPPHVVFVTSETYDGNLIGAAGDGGLLSDGGMSALAAADSLCQGVAKGAGLAGTFVALLTSASEDGFSRIHDADGPWALVDRTPVAETASDLAGGRFHASITSSETGTPIATAFPWSKGTGGSDCAGWTSNDGATNGTAGQNAFISPDAFGSATESCSSAEPLYCAEIGAGGAPNRYPILPAGAKIAFATDITFPGNFASADAGVIDGGPPSGGDAAHAAADAVCNQVARGHGRAGTFHAWLSTSGADAPTYFSSLSMDGPWYRPDGFELAATRAELTSTASLRTQIALGADATFTDVLQNWVWTGANANGTVGSDCSDFTVGVNGTSSRVGTAETIGPFGLSFAAVPCNFPGRLFCFER